MLCLILKCVLAAMQSSEVLADVHSCLREIDKWLTAQLELARNPQVSRGELVCTLFTCIICVLLSHVHCQYIAHS